MLLPIRRTLQDNTLVNFNALGQGLPFSNRIRQIDNISKLVSSANGSENRSLLGNLISGRDIPTEDDINQELANVLFEKVEDRAPVSRDEARRAIDLISSGELLIDVGYSITTLFGFVAKPERFTDIRGNIDALLQGLSNLPPALVTDLNPGAFSQRVHNQIDRLQAGEPLDNPAVLDQTIKTLYTLPEVGDAVDTVSALLHKDNESLRLALLIYARLNGVNLEENDIDEVRETVLDRNNPKLGRLLLYIADPGNASRLIT